MVILPAATSLSSKACVEHFLTGSIEMPRNQAPLSLLKPLEALLVPVAGIADPHPLVSVAGHIFGMLAAPSADNTIDK